MNTQIKKNYTVLFFLALFVLVSITAEPTKLTIEESVSLAMQNNIQLTSTAIDVRMKKRDKDLAWNVFIPNVQASGTMARSNMSEMIVGVPSMSTTVQLEEKDRWNAMGNVSIGLNLNAALFEGLKATRQGYEAGMLTYEQARQQTEQNIRKVFYSILLQEGSLKISKEKLITSEERMRQTYTNFKNGILPELSYLQTQLAVEMQKPSIMEAELNIAQQRNMFAFLLGLPMGTEIELDGEINPTISVFDADELVQKHLGDRLDLALLEKNIELMHTQLRATKLQVYTPSLSLNQSFAPKLSAIDDKWFEKDNWKDQSGAFSLTLAFNLTNLLPFSSMGQKVESTKDSIQKLELARQQALYNAELEIRNLVKKLEKSSTSITAMELNVRIAEKAWRLTEQGFKAGTIEYLDLKDAENTLMQARLGVLSEKFTYISNILDLETALNTELN
ncbi:MAG TPA: TolC family protein [Treponemataceae bacterium]|nr:TolC family protein [Treponemataceae bacterium]